RSETRSDVLRRPLRKVLKRPVPGSLRCWQRHRTRQDKTAKTTPPLRLRQESRPKPTVLHTLKSSRSCRRLLPSLWHASKPKPANRQMYCSGSSESWPKPPTTANGHSRRTSHASLSSRPRHRV